MELRRILSRKNIVILFFILGINIGLFLLQEMNTAYSKEEKEQYISHFSESIDEVLTNAAQIRLFSIFQGDNKYAVSNVDKTERDFKKLRGLTLEVDHDRVTAAVAANKYKNYLILIFIIYILYDLMKEYENGMWNIVHSMSFGRGRFYIRREIALISCVAFLSIIFHLSEIIAGTLMYGIDDFANPIQTLQSFSKCTYMISKGGYLLLYLGSCIVTLTVLSTVIYMLFVIITNRTFAVIIIFLVTGIELTFCKIEALFESRKLLQYINIFHYLDPTEYDRLYYNMNFFNRAVGIKTIAYSLLAILFLFSVSMIFIVGQFRYVTIKAHKILNTLDTFIQKIFSRFHYIGMEIAKSFVCNRLMVLLIAGGVLIIYICGYAKVTFPERQKKIDEIIFEYGGSDTNGFISYVENMQREYEDKSSQAQELYGRQDATVEEKNRAFYLQEEATILNNHLYELQIKVEQIQAYREKGIEIYAVSDRGYNEIIGSNSIVRENVIMIALIIVSAFAAFGCWNYERKSNVISIIKAMPNGNTWLWKRKMAISGLIIFAAFILFYGYDFYKLLTWYQTEFWNAPVQSLSFITERFSIDIRGYVIIKMIYRLLLVTWVYSLISMLATNNKVKNQMYVIFFIACVSLIYLLTNNSSLYIVIPICFIMAMSSLVMIIESKKNWS